ncbi:fungal-specific transcription factor domain-containing protein [Nemania sp. FL0031]|nr:fungal-specific transcription factor domain-containing protein [Nemania sp. FL0031]
MPPLATPETIPSSIFDSDGPSTLTAASITDTLNSTTPSSDLQTHISPNSSHSVEDGEGALAEIDTSLPETQRLVRLYFTHVHPSWPILHQPTFEIDKASKCLVGSMMMNAAYHEGSKAHEKLARVMLSFITGPELMSNPSLHLLQALLLCVVYSLGRLREHAMAAKTTHLNAILISTCRSLGIFEDHHLYHNDMEQEPLSMWLAREQLHRLAFGVLCVDTYISVILDHPPTLRYQELQIPLPMSTPLWEADNTERRRLQWQEPAGRQRVLFSSMMRDVLESGKQDDTPYQLDLIGCHLGLCALQSGVWEAAREAHSSATDELSTKFAPGNSILDWKKKVTGWRHRMEEDCSLQRDYFASATTGIGSTHPCSALSIIIGHLYYMHMYAPVNTLRGAAPYGDGDLAAARRAKISESKRRLRIWTSSPCSRFAVWNAAQISRVIEHELTGNSNTAAFGQNPLAIPSLLTSAIVVCFIANLTSACPLCTSNPIVDRAIDLFETDHDADKLKNWRDSGTGMVSWGPSGIVICSCKTRELMRWFQGRLSGAASAEAELLAFVDSLPTTSL